MPCTSKESGHQGVERADDWTTGQYTTSRLGRRFLQKRDDPNHPMGC